MRPATELGVHHMPVSGSQVVTADPEVSGQQATEQYGEQDGHESVEQTRAHSNGVDRLGRFRGLVRARLNHRDRDGIV